MLSSPLMMDHVRSYYQEKSLRVPVVARLGRESKGGVRGKYIRRTRVGGRRGREEEMKLIRPLIRKRNADELKVVRKMVAGSEAGAELKLVLTKDNQNKAGTGKFSLKRVSRN